MLNRKDIVLIVINIAVLSTVNWLWLNRDRVSQLMFLQTLVLADTLWVLWLYTKATFRLATAAEEQMSFVKTQFVDKKIGELIKEKPIVVADRDPSGNARISNVGDAFAANVWYLVDKDQDPTPLGSLGEGQSRSVAIAVADRHVLIAEQRQMPPGVARKFTPTLNVCAGEAFVHGFIHPAPGALEHRGSIKEYLSKWPDLLERLKNYDPLTHDPDKK
jgi:hypothetical protein